MKLRYLFSIILSALFFAGCAEIKTDSWDNIKLSKTYVSIPAAGGTASVTIEATEEWEFVQGEDWPAWLSVDKVSGGAGETTVAFSAEAVNGGRTAEIQIKAGDNTQFVNVCQGSKDITVATCAEVIAGPEGKSYRVTGTCTAIANTTYGNWYLNDGTGELYIYGTVNSSGSYDWAKFGIEVGDVVTVEGSYVLYGGNTPEFVDATFISVEKALVSVDTEEQTLPKEGGEFDVKVVYKGAGVFPTVPEEYRSWVSIVDMQNKEGVPSKIEPNPADTAIVKISVLPNEAGDRSGSVSFTSGSSTVPYKFQQKGAIIDTNVAGFLAAAEGPTQYRVTGVIKKLTVSADYHNANVTIAGGDGQELYLYRLYGGNLGDIEDLNLEVGDLITVVGSRSSYKGDPQMAQGGNLEVQKKFVPKTVAEFIAAEEGSTEYAVSGEIVGIKDLSESYNNVGITIKGESGEEVLLYRVTTFDGTNVTKLDLKVGGKITVAGKRSSYKGTPQMAAGGICLSYTSPVE